MAGETPELLRASDRFVNLLDQLAELSNLFIWMLAPLFISSSVTVNVLSRRLFALPINGLNDLTSLARPSRFLPPCLAHQSNVKVVLDLLLRGFWTVLVP